jgi:hypothetical protein
VKKFEQRYRRALDYHNSWEELQSRLLKQFGNASAILERLPVFSLLLFSLVFYLVLGRLRDRAGLKVVAGECKCMWMMLPL